jgi:hypothetical protein
MSHSLRSDHECDRDGPPRRFVDESGELLAIRTVATCSTCGKYQTGRSPRMVTRRPVRTAG